MNSLLLSQILGSGSYSKRQPKRVIFNSLVNARYVWHVCNVIEPFGTLNSNAVLSGWYDRQFTVIRSKGRNFDAENFAIDSFQRWSIWKRGQKKMYSQWKWIWQVEIFIYRLKNVHVPLLSMSHTVWLYREKKRMWSHYTKKYIFFAILPIFFFFFYCMSERHTFFSRNFLCNNLLFGVWHKRRPSKLASYSRKAI